MTPFVSLRAGRVSARPFFLLAAAWLGLAAAPESRAEIAYAVDSSAVLISFDTERPEQVLTMGVIRGLAPGERVLAIDFRPADMRLYALGSMSRIYTIDINSAIARAVSPMPFSTPLEGTVFGFDFNPTVDRIRIVSNTGQSLRAHPVTGALVAVDTPLNYASGEKPQVVASAYTNSFFNAASTTLYNIDLGNGALVTQIPPNDGRLNLVGMLRGVDLSQVIGFDISPDTNTAYLVTRNSRGPNCELFQVDLRTAGVTRLGQIGFFDQVGPIAIAPARIVRRD